jgi:hypothetical protein
MRRLIGVALFCCACAGAAWAGEPSDASGITDTLKQRVQDWENATRARDIHAISQIEADDWRSVEANGSVWTKEMDLNDLKSNGKHVRGVLGPIDVKVLSNDIAVVQGTLTEEPAAGEAMAGPPKTYAYMDVFVKREGEWVVVRSQAAKVK